MFPRIDKSSFYASHETTEKDWRKSGGQASARLPRCQLRRKLVHSSGKNTDTPAANATVVVKRHQEIP
jgi:hypothetical protein